MRDYNITLKQMKQMLDVYAHGGTPTITKEWIDPKHLLQEVK